LPDQSDLGEAPNITIIDAGIGNVGSVLRMFEHIGVEAVVASDPAAARQARRVVLPGVGAFDAGMAGLERGGWVEPLEALREKGVPIIGICLGMQLLCRGSEEGAAPGLGWIAADVRRLDTGGDPRLKLPHMGWAEVKVTRSNPLIDASTELPRFYHVHQYRAVCDDPADVIATATYGTEFVTAVQRGSLYGVQFHPEKSHRFGMHLLRRFSELPC
jgi:glutamine amidotransferase